MRRSHSDFNTSVTFASDAISAARFLLASQGLVPLVSKARILLVSVNEPETTAGR